MKVNVKRWQQAFCSGIISSFYFPALILLMKFAKLKNDEHPFVVFDCINLL